MEFVKHTPMIQIQSDALTPEPRPWTRRLTDEDKQVIVKMRPGESFTADKPTALAAVSFGARMMIKLIARKQDDGNYRVWRAEVSNVG